MDVFSRITRSHARRHKRQATGETSPAPSELSDTSMADLDQMVELVRGRFTPELDAMMKEANDRHLQLLAENTSFKVDNIRKNVQIEHLINDKAAMKCRLEQLEIATRSNNVILFNIPEETPGARPIDSVKSMFEKLPGQEIPTEMPTACMRIGKPRTGPTMRPRPI